MNKNPLLYTDFYKADHRRQYPEGTEFVYSNFTPRSTRLFNGSKHFDDRVVFFGLQSFLMELIEIWGNGFFNRSLERVLKEYQEFMDASLGEGAVTTEHIKELHNLGYLPLNIKALPEGSRVNVQVPVFTVMVTDSRFFWLANFLETWMSNEIWKTCTTATIAYEYRRILEDYAEITGAPKEFVNVQGHDFSCRGMSGMEDAAKSGMGHLLSFIGTDTQAAIQHARDVYGEGVIGVSVPATEHSVMCANGMEDELGTFKRLITDLYPSGVVSIVSDTGDFWKVITEFTVELKDEILNRTPNAIGLAKTVFRPDSGDPVKIICGYDIKDFGEEAHDINSLVEDYVRDMVQEETPHGEYGGSDRSLLFKRGEEYFRADIGLEWNRHDKQFYFLEEVYVDSITKIEATPEMKGAVECLWDVFGGTTNEKGFRTIHERVGLIYGDSITLERAEEILSRLKDKGFASDNIVFGIGSYTYQFITRDTLGFAMKATWCQVNGVPIMIQKSPKTDMKKKSAKGLMCVSRADDGSGYVCIDGIEDYSVYQDTPNEMQTVFENGFLINLQQFCTIKERLAKDV